MTLLGRLKNHLIFTHFIQIEMTIVQVGKIHNLLFECKTRKKKVIFTYIFDHYLIIFFIHFSKVPHHETSTSSRSQQNKTPFSTRLRQIEKWQHFLKDKNKQPKFVTKTLRIMVTSKTENCWIWSTIIEMRIENQTSQYHTLKVIMTDVW